MLYCYLTDTALSPFLTNESTGVDKALVNYREKTGFQYNSDSSKWTGGVGQLTERVTSMFNTEYVEEFIDHDGNTKYQQYPNVVMDPRIADNGDTSTTQKTYLTNRLLGLFQASSAYVSGSATERAIGEMQLHYDAYLAAKDDNVKGNFIAALTNDITNNEQFAQVFNIIEACMLSHTYDARDNRWVFQDAATLNSTLSANPGLFGAGSETSPICGYIYNSVSMPLVDLSNNKCAKVRNMNTESTSGIIKTAIGTNSALLGATAPILFPDYIQFAYRFSRLDEVTWFRIYLNPDAFINSYPRCTVTHIICPAKPKDLVNLSYDSVEIALANTSKYVADLMSGEIIKTRGDDTTVDLIPYGITKTYSDILQTTNFTGAASLTTRYVPQGSTNTVATSHMFTFSCIFKGRRPTTAELKKYVRELLESANNGEEVRDIFPDLYADNNYIIIPMYDTRIVSDTNTNITYCSNIYQYEKMSFNYNGHNTCEDVTDQCLTNVRSKSSNFNVPAYYMHAYVYPESFLDSSVLRFDELSVFQSFQPIASTDVYWGTMSDEAREFNTLITKVIAYQLTGYKPEGMEEVTEEVKALFKVGSDGKIYPKESTTAGTDINRTYLSFAVGAYSFSVMTRESYSNNCRYILTLDQQFQEGKTYYVRTGSGTSESPYVYTKAIVIVGEDIPADTYYERVVA